MLVVLRKAVVRPARGSSFARFLQPSGSDGCGAVKLGHVGLDVQQRRAVEHVHVLDVQNAVLDPVQLHDGETDGIGPPGGAGGEEAAVLGVQKRNNLQLESLAAVEVVEENDVREPIEILQPGLVGGENLDRPMNTGRADRLDGHSLGLGEGCVKDTDGFEFDHLRSLVVAFLCGPVGAPGQELELLASPCQ